MEEGETPLQAAQRELMEETGYGKGEWSLLMDITPNPSSMSNFTHCFLAKGVEKIGPAAFGRHRRAGSASAGRAGGEKTAPG